MIVLGIETSCDETAAAVVRDRGEVLSNVIHSQVKLHAPYGGVVPEIASRSHLERLPGVVRQAMEDARMAWEQLDGIAVTYGPGLASSLLVGLSAAKGLALSLGRPLVGVHHLAAHLYSVFLAPEAFSCRELLPILGLVVSGGHTLLIEVARDGACRVVGQTLDDAAGEAFDKAAQILGLGYPGGPEIERAARRATAAAAPGFPRGRIRPGNPALGSMRAELCFSFSGLKTSLMSYCRQSPPENDAQRDAIAAGYQEAIVDALAGRCDLALKTGGYRSLAVGGGVSLNQALRERLRNVVSAHGLPLLLPPPAYCGDNAAMIAALAAAGGGRWGDDALSLDVVPSLTLDQVSLPVTGVDAHASRAASPSQTA